MSDETRQDWAARAENELRGKPLDELTWVSPRCVLQQVDLLPELRLLAHAVTHRAPAWAPRSSYHMGRC